VKFLLDPLSFPAQVVFVSAAAVLLAFGIVGTVLGTIEGDGQTALVLPFIAFYIGAVYVAVIAVDRLVRAGLTRIGATDLRKGVG
jgi:hypothetical protein